VQASDPFEHLILDHVAVAVTSIDQALPVMEALTRATGSRRERVPAQGVELCFLETGAAALEILQPLGPETPVGRFLEKRGPGLHHIAYRAGDLEAELQRLSDAGFELIDAVPRPGAQGHRVAFIHPRSTGGVLIELVGE
jgi:methylmalonyl-CoA/ethylmalonyl-CoA epimerase